MKKIVLCALLLLLIISNLNAENIEYDGCVDIIRKKDTQNAKQIENWFKTNIKVKEDFLKSLGFNITKTIDYKIVCSSLIFNFNKNIDSVNMLTNNEYKNSLLNSIEKQKELSYGDLNKIIHYNLLEVNNISLKQYSDTLDSKLNSSK